MGLAEKSDLPTLEDELNRKLLDTVIALVDKYDNGDLSVGAYKESLAAINGVVRGLVDESVIELMDKERSRVDFMEDRQTAVFSNEKDLVAISRACYDGRVSVLAVRNGNVIDKEIYFDEEDVPFEAASEHMDDLCQLLGKKMRRWI